MARVVVIFAILSLITGAMFWLARLPNQHPDVVATIRVASSEAAAPTPATSGAASEPTAAVTTPAPSADAVPPAETAQASSVPPLPTTGAEANILQQTMTTGAQTGLVVENVEGTGDNSISLRGRADPGATVKISVDGKAEGEVVVGGTGTWSISVNKAKDEAEPKIVLELIAADGKMLDKTNFVFKKTPLAAPPLAPQDHTLITAQAAAPKAEEVHRPQRKHRATLRVRRGESLWRIAKRRYGDGDKWRKIYEANRARIGDDPDYLRAGTRLVLPG